MTTHDFGDGQGEVPAHRHINGGGWVANTAIVSPSARVSDKAWVFGEAWVFGDAQVSGEARVFGEARVSGKARVFGTPITIIGYEHIVTICDDEICVGCQSDLTEKWASGWTPEQAPLLEEDRDLIIAIARAHQNRSQK